MDIVRMRSGLGNQMFCYAFYLELLHKGRNAEIDMGFYTKYPDWPDPYMLEHVFPEISITPIEEEHFNSICERYKEDISNPGRKEYLEMHPDERYFWGEATEDVGCFRPEIYETKDCAFVGTWYSEKYFADVPDKVRTRFRFREGENKLGQLADEITTRKSVSLNIRLGRAYSYVDMITPNGNTIANIAQDGYYSRAISRMKDEIGTDAVWYVFSDAVKVLSGEKDANRETETFQPKNISVDPGVKNYLKAIDIIKSELKALDVVFVSDSMFDEYEDWYDLFLMSKTQHNIIANSSFGWWGAWLNNNPEKTVIAPKKFFSTSECRDIYPQEWIRL